MGERKFRFGAVVGQPPTLEGFTGLAQRAEELGYDTLLTPDPLHQLDPLTALAAAAAVTTRLRVSTFVLAASFRDAKSLAWQARSLHAFTGGRFELGLGVGRPDAARFSAELGREFGSGSRRLAQLAEVITEVKRQPEHPPILIAGVGPKVLELAGREADTVTLAWQPKTTATEAKSIVDRFRTAAGARAEDVELGVNLLAAGDEPAPWLEKFVGASVAELAAGGAMTVLPGSTRQAADTLRRWREELGISYVSINSGYLEQFAPVIETLRGD
jgi:probable F420-dependent oxidoreductase